MLRSFGESFIAWVQLLYFHLQAIIRKEGSRSENVFFHTGTREVYTMLLLLFALASKLLATPIKENEDIVGIKRHSSMLFFWGNTQSLLQALKDTMK